MRTIIFDFSQVLWFDRELAPFSGGQPVADRYVLNQPVLDLLVQQPGQKVIFTASDRVHEPLLQVQLRPIFHEIFTIKEVGYSKTDSAAYHWLVERLSIEPQEALFVDDSAKNVQAAQQAGLHVMKYHHNEDLIPVIVRWLNEGELA